MGQMYRHPDERNLKDALERLGDLLAPARESGDCGTGQSLQAGRGGPAAPPRRLYGPEDLRPRDLGLIGCEPGDYGLDRPGGCVHPTGEAEALLGRIRATGARMEMMVYGRPLPDDPDRPGDPCPPAPEPRIAFQPLPIEKWPKDPPWVSYGPLIHY